MCSGGEIFPAPRVAPIVLILLQFSAHDPRPEQSSSVTIKVEKTGKPNITSI